MSDLINEIIYAYYFLGGWYGWLCFALCVLGFFVTCKFIFLSVKALITLCKSPRNTTTSHHNYNPTLERHEENNDSFDMYDYNHNYDYRHMRYDDTSIFNSFDTFSND